MFGGALVSMGFLSFMLLISDFLYIYLRLGSYIKLLVVGGGLAFGVNRI